MKKYAFIVTAIALAGFTSCGNKVEEPESADFSWYLYSDYSANLLDLSKANENPDTIELSDQICFVAKSADANSYVVWTGEPGHSFDERELSGELLKDTNNNVSQKAMGVALSTTDGKGRKIKTYTFSSISEVGNPFQMYCTARNYNYESGEFSEIKKGPYSIVVVDSQVDLWNPDDLYNANGATKYDITVKFLKTGTTNKYSTVNKNSSGAKGSYELVFEDAEKGIKPGVKVTYPAGTECSDCQVIIKVNNCIPVSEVGTITYNADFGTYTWKVDLTTPQIITLKSQSAAEDAKSGDKYTKDYEFTAVPYTE